MSKKIIATAALALAALLLLSACGGGGESSLAPSSDFPDSASSIASPANEGSGTVGSQSEEPSSSALSSLPEEPLTQTISVPEGYTLARIGMLLEEKDICTADEFIAASQTGDYSEFPLAAEQALNSDSCFQLEGLLFPDTYEIYSSDPPEAIIRRMLANTEEKIDDSLRAQIAQSGYTAGEIITLASIIEKEAFGHEQMPNISSVLHNRLDIDMQLQCDVTITYVEGAIKPFITGDKDRYNSVYNTYKCEALPAGPICNPGIDAIKAALNPADTDYLYFVTDADKNYYYAATWDEHEENVAAAGIG